MHKFHRAVESKYLQGSAFIITLAFEMCNYPSKTTFEISSERPTDDYDFSESLSNSKKMTVKTLLKELEQELIEQNVRSKETYAKIHKILDNSHSQDFLAKIEKLLESYQFEKAMLEFSNLRKYFIQ